MKCPFCGHPDTQVLDTRASDEGDAIRRRRRCMGCERRFTTYERTELTMPVVVKRNGNRSDYDRAKLRASMALALRKRPVGMLEVDRAVARIEDALLTRGAREVASQTLGELVMMELQKLDKVAYVRFASVYQSFEDLGAFIDAIDAMQGARRPRGEVASAVTAAVAASEAVASETVASEAVLSEAQAQP